MDVLFTPCPVLHRIITSVLVNDLTGCWEWQKNIEDGYGRIGLKGRSKLVHRVLYSLAVADPGSLCVLHECDNPKCCNPDHLFLGTRTDNNADRDAKGRQAKGLRNGRHTRSDRTARGDRNGIRRNPELVRGENSGRALLTQSQVDEIRSRYAEGGITQPGLAKIYGVNPQVIHLIIRRKTWRK